MEFLPALRAGGTPRAEGSPVGPLHERPRANVSPEDRTVSVAVDSRFRGNDKRDGRSTCGGWGTVRRAPADHWLARVSLRVAAGPSHIPPDQLALSQSDADQSDAAPDELHAIAQKVRPLLLERYQGSDRQFRFRWLTLETALAY
jgi:hypothetical protein